MTKEKTDLSKLSTEEINKLYNDGKISIAEADKLRKGGGIEDNGISRKIRDGKSDKKREIIKLYKEGGLSISDTIAYENNLLLERNRKNTSTTASIVVVYVIIIVLAFFFWDDLFF